MAERKCEQENVGVAFCGANFSKRPLSLSIVSREKKKTKRSAEESLANSSNLNCITAEDSLNRGSK